MAIGKHDDNYEFYKGYEGESEVILTSDGISYHIWEGYFEDIFGNPIFTKDGWHGFTRDYNEFKYTFDDSHIECAIVPDEYLNDINQYREQSFEYSESKDVVTRIIKILEKAKETNDSVLVKIS